MQYGCVCTAPTKKDGEDHRYFSIVENRCAGRSVQHTALYLGEINDHQQQAAWPKTLKVFDSVPVKLSGLELRRSRAYGNCWLACEL